MQALCIALYMYHYLAIFADQPLAGFIERRKLQLVFYLFKFRIGKMLAIQPVLIVLFQDISEIIPEFLLGFQVRTIRPL